MRKIEIDSKTKGWVLDLPHRREAIPHGRISQRVSLIGLDPIQAIAVTPSSFSETSTQSRLQHSKLNWEKANGIRY